jgi:hypothetical protein
MVSFIESTLDPRAPSIMDIVVEWFSWSDDFVKAVVLHQVSGLIAPCECKCFYRFRSVLDSHAARSGKPRPSAAHAARPAGDSGHSFGGWLAFTIGMA